MYKILLVDDDQLVRKGIISGISKEDLDVDEIIEAGDGQKALEIYLGRNDIDIIISDIKMPKMDGVSLIKAVKKHDQGMPIVIVSGFNDFMFLRQAIQYGVDDYLLKPIDAVELMDVLRAVLEKKALKPAIESTGVDQILDYAFFRLVEGNIGSHEFQQKLEMYGYEMGQGPYSVVGIQVRPVEEHNLFTIADKLNQKLEASGRGRVFVHPAQRLVGILFDVQDQKKSFSDFTRLLHEIGNVSHSDISCTFGKIVEDIESITFSFHSLRRPRVSDEQGYSVAIRKVLSYLDVHFKESVSLKILSDRFQISAAYLGSLFKKEVGLNFTDYVNKKRIDYAKELLRHSTLKVYEIVEQTGFTDKNYFMRIFKKYTGTTPKQIR